MWSFGYAGCLEEGGIRALLGVWSKADYYPPLNYTIWALIHYLFEPSRFSIPIANALVWIPGFWAMFAIASRATQKPWAGILACVLMIGAPHFFFYFPIPSYEIPMASMQMVMLWGVLASERFEKPLPLSIAAIALAAGMLIKWTFIAGALGIILFSVGDLLLFALQNRRIGKRLLTRRQLASMSIASLLALLLAGPWYLFVLSWDKVFFNAVTDPLTAGFLEHIAWHAIQLYREVLWPVLAVSFLVSVPFLIFNKSKRMAFAILIPFMTIYAVFSLIPHKESRFITILIPLCTLSIGIAWSNLFAVVKGKKIFQFVLILIASSLALFAFYQHNELLFQWDTYPTDSGELKAERLECLNEADQLMVELKPYLERVSQKPTVRVAIHPLSPISFSFSSDVIAYDLARLNIQGNTRYELIGFGVFQYTDFQERFDQADILLVPESVWKMNRAEVEKALIDMTHYTHPGMTPPKAPADDPLFAHRIASHYKPVGRIEVKCESPILVYEKIYK